MGTRGLLGLIVEGKRHAAYNHWDSYPSGLGAKIVKFILSLSREEYAKMTALVQAITVKNFHVTDGSILLPSSFEVCCQPY